MTYTVVSAPIAESTIAFAFYPEGVETEGAGRAYRIFSARGRTEDMSFIDPIDGDVLIDMRSFDSLDRAKRWIEQEVNERRG